ncbi:MAG: polysaccharide biosynthesis/export family protein [Verrucomicrobiae bacterium]|nr:polysaccharide biosynthesis/export family protein [Verrucomicrobiae bacterium]
MHSSFRFAVLAIAAAWLLGLAGRLETSAAPAPGSAPARPVAPSASVPPEGASKSAGQDYKFSPGDKVTLRVVESRDEPVTLTVSPSGEIEVPYLGRRLVIGKSIPQVEVELKQEYEKDYYYTATVKIAVEAINAVPNAQAIRRIYVTGQVPQQGAQEIPPGELYTVSRAILKAGGLGPFANGRKITIVRKSPDRKSREEERIVVDVLSILEDGKVENDVELKAEDLIIVPEKLINW